MVKYIREGEAIPFGFGHVRYRFDMLAHEVAPLPINYLIRLVNKLQRDSLVPMSHEDVERLKVVQEIRHHAYEQGYANGLQFGREQGHQEMLKAASAALSPQPKPKPASRTDASPGTPNHE